MLAKSQKHLQSLGVDRDLSADEKREILIEVIENFSNAYKAQVHGQRQSEMTIDFLSDGLSLDVLLNEKLKTAVQCLEPFKDLSDIQVLRAIRNALPVGSRMITSEVALNFFIQKEIKNFEPVTMEISDLAFQRMISMIEKNIHENIRFPKLNTAIITVVTHWTTGQAAGGNQRHHYNLFRSANDVCLDRQSNVLRIFQGDHDSSAGGGFAEHIPY